MYLKTLTCKGFKSFADRSVLSLEPGITAIIGPNGSGKSNVLDAVLWVLGERNARNLRGQAMEDVIFAGSTTRRHVGMAEVVLVLDNSDGTLPIDYDEVSISRRMYRSGESEYLINGSLCRRMDVLDILHDTGLGTGTHSIISQGHLDSVLQSRPEDRRALIEEAAGILKHKQRKARSEHKLERMDQHLLRIRDINNEVERQLKPLERKAKRAISYRDLTAELAEVALDLAVDDLRILQGKWDEACRREREVSAQAAGKASAAEAAEEEGRELQERLRRHTEGAGAAAEQLHQATRAFEQLDSAIMLLREKKRSSLRVLEERRVKLEADIARLDAAREAGERAEEALGEAAADKARADEALKALSAERDRVSREFGDLRRQISKDEQREAQLKRDGDRLRAAKDKADDAMSSSVADAKLLVARKEDAEGRLAAAEEKLREVSEAFSQAEGELERAAAADEACRMQSREAFAAADAKRAELEGARAEDARLSVQVASLEEAERVARAANKALTWAVSARADLGADVLLSEVLGIPEDATAAVEALLADAADALIVRDADAADAAIGCIAGAAREGSVALVALEAAPRERGAFPPGLPGTMLSDVLECGGEYRRAVERLLGDVLLCDTMQDALECARALDGAPFPWRAVSKDGCIVESTGVRRFSKPAEGSVGALERHRDLERARRRLAEAQGRRESCEKDLAAAEEALRALQREGLERASARAQAQGKRDSLSEQVDQATSEVVRQQAELEDIERRRERNDALIRQMRPDSERIQAELATAADELAAVRERLDDLREQLQPLRKRNGKLNEQHTEARLEAGRLSEREAYARRMAEGHRGDIARLEQQVQRERHEAAGDVQIGAIDAIAEVLVLIRSSVSPHISAIERSVEAYRSGTAEIHAQADGKRREAAALREEADRLNARLSDTRVEKGRLEVQVEAAISVIKEDCATPLEQALDRPPLTDRAGCEEQAESLRRRISRLGAINPDAAEEYEELKARYDFLQSQVDDMMEARRSLSKIVNAIDTRMKDDFIDTFHAVDENFQRIFGQLFPGGSASLSLVDEEDPERTGVEVNAQPRGKRISKMSLMSGGEKSLTALALLFAVYATRPTPFYILDEVEAALDDTNLRRLCAYLEDMRLRTQLIMITHQRRTMEMADVLYGVSMQSDGVTKVISQKLNRAGAAQEG